MSKSIQTLKKNLMELSRLLRESSVTRSSFQDHGWNQISLDKNYIEYLVDGFLDDVNVVSGPEFSQDVNDKESYVLNTARHINGINNNMMTQFRDDASSLINTVSNILVTLLTLHLDFKDTFLRWEVLADKKLLPQQLSRRIKATEARISSLDENCEGIEVKVQKIKDAYDTAENLPTYLQEIIDGRLKLEQLIVDANDNILLIRELEKEAKSNLASIGASLEKATDNANETDSLKAKCDDNLQITTTQGLAAGFDQKAISLSNSIKYWVLGLVFALFAGAILGGEQVRKLSAILDSSQQVGAGFAIINIVLAIFSIGGPLWFAWLATQQINQRFKLSEDYAYKATVAKSYTGFSKHATKFDDKTAERLFNSTLDRLDEMPLRLVDGKDYNSPWHEFIDSDAFKKALDLVPELAGKATKFASHTNLKDKISTSTREDSSKAFNEKSLKTSPDE